MKNKGILFVLSGPAGTGKGTVCKKFFENNPDTFFSVSATTRKPRKGETDGKEYYFISKEEFERKIGEDGFLEYAEFCGNYYGTPLKAVQEKLSQGINVLLEIEVKGAMQIKNKMPDSVLIFIAPPSKKILRERIEGRATEPPEIIEKRMKEAEKELSMINNYDYIIINDEVEKAAKRFETIKKAEQLKTIRNNEFIQEVCK